MNLVSLLILPAVITLGRGPCGPRPSGAGYLIAGLGLVVLIVAIAFSKRKVEGHGGRRPAGGRRPSGPTAPLGADGSGAGAPVADAASGPMPVGAPRQDAPARGSRAPPRNQLRRRAGPAARPVADHRVSPGSAPGRWGRPTGPGAVAPAPRRLRSRAPRRSGRRPAAPAAPAGPMAPPSGRPHWRPHRQAPAFISPDGPGHVDPTQPFRWGAVPGASEYCLTVGTAPGSDDVVNSGPLAAGQTSYQVPSLPGGQAAVGSRLQLGRRPVAATPT